MGVTDPHQGSDLMFSCTFSTSYHHHHQQQQQQQHYHPINRIKMSILPCEFPIQNMNFCLHPCQAGRVQEGQNAIHNIAQHINTMLTVSSFLLIMHVSHIDNCKQ
jgi:hypothetical protein